MTIALEKILLAEMLWLLAASIEGITVERNYYAYYKLPIKLINANRVTTKHNKSQIAYVLQCPHRSSVEIPQPKDMEKCNIVGHYREEPRKTKLNIPYKVPEPQLKLPIPTTTTTTRPWLYTGDYFGSYDDCLPKNPTKSRKRYRQRQKSRTKWPKRLIRESKASAVLPEDEQETEDLSGISGEELSTETEEETTTISSESSQAKPETILKMLNVKSAIAAFKRSLLQPSIFVANHVNRSEEEGVKGDILEMDKFFAEHVSSDKRDKRLGYQNMYHRDETYSDHIFYDDFDEGGAFASDTKSSGE